MPVVGEIRTNPNDETESATWNGRQWVIARGGVAQRSRTATPPPLPAQQEQTLRDARAVANTAMTDVRSLDRFREANRRTGTGGVFGLPVVGGLARNLARPFSDDLQVMNSVASRMAPNQRVPGSGSSSDTDVRLFLEAGPGIDRSRAANETIIGDARVEAQRRRARSAFLESWVQTHPNINGGEAAFDRYWTSRMAPPQGGAGGQAQGNEVPVLSPEQARAAPAGTRYRTTDGREMIR